MSDKQPTGRWLGLVITRLREPKPPTYNTNFNNPQMYPSISQPKVVKTLDEFTPEQLAEITQRLGNDPRHDRLKATIAMWAPKDDKKKETT